MNTEPHRRPRGRHADASSGYTSPAGDLVPVPARVSTVTKLLRENERLRSEVERLRAEALTDPLTGLANRRNLDERLAAELSRAVRYGQPLAVICVDVDDFKRVNDTWGHAKGDEVLVWVGRFLRSQIRAHDIAGRIGGDEFVVVLPATDHHGAEAVAERLRRALADLTAGARAAGQSHAVALSIGVAALVPGDAGMTGDQLLRAADEAMYRHKGQRKRAP